MAAARRGDRGDQTSVSTSIALLQERFRQLQKMREKREKEHQRLIYSESEHIMAATNFEHAKMNYKNEQIFVSRQPHQESPLSLGLELYNKNTNFQSSNILQPTKFWSNSQAATTTTARTSSYNSEKWDVDTSLHL